eukprot:scaffold32415_cov73-Isochrysis_galbana.AAC.1
MRARAAAMSLSLAAQFVCNTAVGERGGVVVVVMVVVVAGGGVVNLPPPIPLLLALTVQEKAGLGRLCTVQLGGLGSVWGG